MLPQITYNTLNEMYPARKHIHSQTHTQTTQHKNFKSMNLKREKIGCCTQLCHIYGQILFIILMIYICIHRVMASYDFHVFNAHVYVVGWSVCLHARLYAHNTRCMLGYAH